MTVQESDVSSVLTLWEAGAITSRGVIEWADQEILRSDCPLNVLIELSLEGPDACLAKPIADFPQRALGLRFPDAYALRLYFVDASSKSELLEFARWAAQNCAGESLTEPEVKRSYLLDHYLNDSKNEERAFQATLEDKESISSRALTILEELLRKAPSVRTYLKPSAR